MKEFLTMGKAAECTVVIPAYNEEAALTRFLPELLDFCSSEGHCLVMVDDCSQDGTFSILNRAAEEHHFMKVIHHKVNRGYGGALISGLEAVETPLCLTMDADGQHRLCDVSVLLSKQQETDADMVVGCRSGGDSGGGSGWYRALGKKLIRGLAGLLVDLPISDLNSGMKLYRTELVQRYLPLCPDGMAFSEVITLIFAQQKHFVTEAPIQVESRKEGTSTISTRTALDTVIQILNIVMVFNPMRIFFPCGLAALILGFLWAIPFFVMGHGLSSVSMLLMTTGLILVMLGLIAEQLSQIRRSLMKK